MHDILFLAHRIPYPPDKGEKIRAWNILRHLATHHRVHLATFIDAPDDVRGVERLQQLCASVVWRRLKPGWAKLRSLTGLMNGAPLTQGYFGDRWLHAAVNRIVAQHRPSLIYVFSSAMAPYALNHTGARVILDMVDLDSEKWRQYAGAGAGILRKIYKREGRTLLGLERRAAAGSDAVLFVSRAEAELFINLAPESGSRVRFVNNGVDAQYFDPQLQFMNPFGARPALVFTGVMNYRPNVEAMIWFVEQVMPHLQARLDNPCLWIVGSNPAGAVLALAGPDVKVTGRVPDVRPYLRYATAVVAPLQIGRGIQNKVLEAMAMGAAVIATPQAREGLDRCRADELIVKATPAEFATAVGRCLDGEADNVGFRARARVVCDYSWATTLRSLDELLYVEMRSGSGLSRLFQSEPHTWIRKRLRSALA